MKIKIRNIIDWELLIKFYKNKEWKHNLFYVDDFLYITKKRDLIRRRLNLLVKDGLLDKSDSKIYPNYWIPKNDKKLRALIEKKYKNLLRRLLK